jgi:hypothetical protein
MRQTPKNNFDGKYFFWKMTSLKIFYDGNYFTPKQTEHKCRNYELYEWSVEVALIACLGLWWEDFKKKKKDCGEELKIKILLLSKKLCQTKNPHVS